MRLSQSEFHKAFLKQINLENMSSWAGKIIIMINFNTKIDPFLPWILF